MKIKLLLLFLFCTKNVFSYEIKEKKYNNFKWEYVLLHDKKEIGYIVFEKNKKQGEILAFYTNPSYRKQNFATILMFQALDKLFLKENVDIVFILPIPSEIPTKETTKITELSSDELMNIYNKKFGFEIEKDSILMYLTKQRYVELKNQQLKSKL